MSTVGHREPTAHERRIAEIMVDRAEQQGRDILAEIDWQEACRPHRAPAVLYRAVREEVERRRAAG